MPETDQVALQSECDTSGTNLSLAATQRDLAFETPCHQLENARVIEMTFMGWKPSIGQWQREYPRQRWGRLRVFPVLLLLCCGGIGGCMRSCQSSLQQPVSQSAVTISPESADQIAQLAYWSTGVVDEVAYSPDGRLMVVVSSLAGVYLYDVHSMTGLWQNERARRWELA